MRMKKAVSEAQMYGDAYNWVAADQDKNIFAFTKKPTLMSHFWTAQPSNRKYIGKYTGAKCWDRTLRRVPKEAPVVFDGE